MRVLQLCVSGRVPVYANTSGMTVCTLHDFGPYAPFSTGHHLATLQTMSHVESDDIAAKSSNGETEVCTLDPLRKSSTLYSGNIKSLVQNRRELPDPALHTQCLACRG